MQLVVALFLPSGNKQGANVIVSLAETSQTSSIHDVLQYSQRPASPDLRHPPSSVSSPTHVHVVISESLPKIKYIFAFSQSKSNAALLGSVTVILLVFQTLEALTLLVTGKSNNIIVLYYQVISCCPTLAVTHLQSCTCANNRDTTVKHTH